MPYTPVSNFHTIPTQEKVSFCGFIDTLKPKKQFGFLTVRSGLEKVQCVYDTSIDQFSLTENIENLNIAEKSDSSLNKNETNAIQCDEKLKLQTFSDLNSIPVESFLLIFGEVHAVKKEIKSCTVQTHEIHVKGVFLINKATSHPFLLKDITKQDCETDVLIKTRLDNRSLDLRSKPSHSIIRMIDEVIHSFRTFLREKDFIEMKTPKLLESGSEGGANLFEVKYFKKKAYLAQSPQLYKQMMILGGFKRVFEIGHVYRQEESNINRYLSEFIGLDLEMECLDYNEMIQFIYKLFIFIFDRIKAKTVEYNNLKEYFNFTELKYTSSPIILTHRECIDLLKEKGEKIDYEEDFSRSYEKILGNIVQEKYETDFFIIKNYPKKVRAFYTQPIKNSIYSESYDGILRGEEIFSGAMRITDPELLENSARESNINPETLHNYINSFKYGAPSHAGCGIGLERFMKSYFDGKDIRLFHSFPRDPNRLSP